MPARPEIAARNSRASRLRELAGYFLWLGMTGFGGPVALCGLMERDLVERRRWLDKSEMRDVIAVCQTMPGPLAVQVGIFIGYLRGGFLGAWISGWSLILPASVMVASLAAAFVHLHGLPWLNAVIYGVSPAVIALILESWWRLVRLGMEDRFQYAVATVCVMATLIIPGMLTVIFLAAGLLGVGWYSFWARQDASGAKLHDVASLLLLAKLAWFFLITGAFTFGGGLAIVPLLQKGLVQEGQWLTAPEFLTAIAVGMVTPGPVMTAATFAGYLVAGPLGALICTIAIYLPSFLLVMFAAPPLMRHRANLLVQSFVKGVYAASIGAILAAAIVLGGHAIGDWTTAIIAVTGFVALFGFRINGPLLIGAAAIIGLVSFQLLRPNY